MISKFSVQEIDVRKSQAILSKIEAKVCVAPSIPCLKRILIMKVERGRVVEVGVKLFHSLIVKTTFPTPLFCSLCTKTVWSRGGVMLKLVTCIS